MSTDVVDAQVTAGAGDVPEETVQSSVESLDKSAPTKASEENKFQQAIASWRSMRRHLV